MQLQSQWVTHPLKSHGRKQIASGLDLKSLAIWASRPPTRPRNPGATGPPRIPPAKPSQHDVTWQCHFKSQPPPISLLSGVCLGLVIWHMYADYRNPMMRTKLVLQPMTCRKLHCTNRNQAPVGPRYPGNFLGRAPPHRAFQDPFRVAQKPNQNCQNCSSRSWQQNRNFRSCFLACPPLQIVAATFFCRANFGQWNIFREVLVKYV